MTHKLNIVKYYNMKYFHKEALNDKWLIEEIFNYKKNGYFIDAGALNGISNNATYLLETKYDWKGICIEPSSFYNKLKQNRNCITVNKCLLDKNNKVEFIECVDRMTVSGVHEKLLELEKKSIDNQKERISFGCNPIKDYFRHTTQIKKELESITLLDLLNKYNAPETIEYLGLDIEGSEYCVLEHYFKNNKTYTILAITIEETYCNKLLEKNGYIHVKNKTINSSLKTSIIIVNMLQINLLQCTLVYNILNLYTTRN